MGSRSKGTRERKNRNSLTEVFSRKKSFKWKKLLSIATEWISMYELHGKSREFSLVSPKAMIRTLTNSWFFGVLSGL